MESENSSNGETTSNDGVEGEETVTIIDDGIYVEQV